MWLSKSDNKGNDVNLHLENIYLDQLQEDGLLLYKTLQVTYNFTAVPTNEWQFFDLRGAKK